MTILASSLSASIVATTKSNVDVIESVIRHALGLGCTNAIAARFGVNALAVLCKPATLPDETRATAMVIYEKRATPSWSAPPRSTG